MKVEMNRKVKNLTLHYKERINKRIDLPENVYVPKLLLEDQIFGAATARVNGRFPILAYYNHDLNVSIWRSSEPV